jgi:hypothetical protein
MLLQTSPFPDPDQLVVMWEADLERERPLIEVSYANFLDWQAQSRTFEDMAAFGSVNWGHVLTGTVIHTGLHHQRCRLVHDTRDSS